MKSYLVEFYDYDTGVPVQIRIYRFNTKLECKFFCEMICSKMYFDTGCKVYYSIKPYKKDSIPKRG